MVLLCQWLCHLCGELWYHTRADGFNTYVSFTHTRSSLHSHTYFSLKRSKLLALVEQLHFVDTSPEQGVKLLGLLLTGSTGQHMAGRNGLA
jgi:hypothetical protein